MKKVLAVLLVCLLLLSVAGCTSTSNKQTSNKSSGSYVSGQSGLTVSQKKEIAEKQAMVKLLEYMKLMKSQYSKYDIDSTRYKIGSITNKGNEFTVNGTLYLYDKYGSLKDTATFSSKVTVKDNGEYNALHPTIKIQ